jgi:hypothetical protein
MPPLRPRWIGATARERSPTAAGAGEATPEELAMVIESLNEIIGA